MGRREDRKMKNKNKGGDKMNKRLGACLIPALLFMFICFTYPQVVYADEDEKELKFRILAVPLFAQQTYLWCWAASGEMIMGYLGKEVPQCEQANMRFRRSDCCQKTGIAEDCISVGWPQYHKYEFTSEPKSSAIEWDELVRQIDCKKPVGFSWEWSDPETFGPDGHYMVARGYIIINDLNLVVVNDPAPWCEDRHKGGSIKIMTYLDYDSFTDYYKHWFDDYQITKKINLKKGE